jgi:uncharacterized protein
MELATMTMPSLLVPLAVLRFWSTNPAGSRVTRMSSPASSHRDVEPRSSLRERSVVRVASFLTTLALALAVLLPATPRIAFAYAPPTIAGYVNDPSNQLTASEKTALNAKLDAHRRSFGHHIVVFLPSTLAGESIEDVAYTTFNTWKIGDAGKDNGVLLVIAKNERKARIETGKGVGGDLPDLKTHQILASSVTPQMKLGRTFAAVDLGTSEIMRALGGTGATAGGTYPVKTTPYKSGSGGGTGSCVAAVLAVVFILLFCIVFIWMIARAIRRGGGGGGGGGGGYWSGSSSGSSWSSSDSSSSDWGGSSGGSDYSGGGGESGGGGSSDSW